MADARKDKRTLLSLKIRYKSATLADFIERNSGDISRGGVFIKAKKPLAVGTLLKFEFLLQDQSSLIHGVGRVVWRRDPDSEDADNPAGMGIKFIKMDPDSRALVQRIAEGRADPGVYDRGSRPSPVRAASSNGSDTMPPEDRTKVRHVSEFLASAFEEGGAAEETMNEARAGAQRARQQSNSIGARRGPARGALGGANEVPTAKRAAAPEATSRSAMSAFGNGGSVSQAMAEPLEEFDADDDFLDHEATRVHDYPDPDATVVGGSTAGSQPQPRLTPVAPKPTASRLETEVPDLFGPDIANSFQPEGALSPAPGEFLDSRLLDPAVPTVPPPAGLPTGPGIPVEAFKPPTKRAPAPPSPYTADGASGAAAAPAKPRSTGAKQAVLWLVLLAALAGGGVAAWQFGVVDTLKELAAPYVGDEIEVIERPAPTRLPDQAATEEVPVDTVEEAVAEAVAPQEAVAAAAPAAKADTAGVVNVVIKSRPARAFIAVDGKPAGRAPVTLKLLPGAKVTLVARARGYLPKTQPLTVGESGSTLTIALPTLPYFVEVSSNPAGARANAVGGGEINTPGDMRFKSMLSPREIVVSKDGYKTVTKKVSRKDFREESKRMVTSISVTLQPEEAADVAAVPVQAPSAEEPALEAAPDTESPEPVQIDPAAEVPAEVDAPTETDAPAAP